MRIRLPGKDVPWKTFFRTVAKRWSKDDLGDFAAALTYYGVLALFPFLLFLVSLGSLVISAHEIRQIVQQLERIAPAAVGEVIGQRLQTLISHPSPSLLTIGVLGAIWAASGAVMGLMRALNAVNEIPEDPRPFWKTRLIGLGMTLVSAVISLASGLIIVVAVPVANAVGGAVAVLILVLRFPVAAVLMALLWALLYWALPARKRPFQPMKVGTLFAVGLWLLASWLFGFYASHFGSYEATYGTLGGIIILLVWMYISSSAVLLGAEINAVLEGPPSAEKS